MIAFSPFPYPGRVFLAAAPSGRVSPFGSMAGYWGGGGPQGDVAVDWPAPLSPGGGGAQEIWRGRGRVLWSRMQKLAQLLTPDEGELSAAVGRDPGLVFIEVGWLGT